SVGERRCDATGRAGARRRGGSSRSVGRTRYDVERARARCSGRPDRRRCGAERLEARRRGPGRQPGLISLPFLEAGTAASLAVVVLGVAASVGWGIADFGGGLASRRGPLLGVLLSTQLVALAIALPLAGLAGEPSLATPDIGLAVLAGVTG